MHIKLIQTGKTHFKFVDSGFEEFTKRLKHYCKLENILIELPSKLKSTDINLIKKNEGELLLKKIQSTDFVVLLDEKGKEFNSIEFASNIQKLQLHYATIVFVIGGAYGFSKEVYERANSTISLSKMTFSHQLIRLIFIEQLYRAFTILKGEPYHHE
ncbi:MAG: 23S rRNA (pseudouridine(1915)-N(3))-methyltransferase RlmH [Bacteroidia bacterium]|nr:23S rRNA (pseudouridine(1915)-N(3))-methyltransferase RlmH [Bacteroidia bacterium]